MSLRSALQRAGLQPVARPALEQLSQPRAADRGLARPSLERLLLAAVRLEFRGEVFVAPRGSSLLGSGCEVACCTENASDDHVVDFYRTLDSLTRQRGDSPAG